jgi:hypothetical protein
LVRRGQDYHPRDAEAVRNDIYERIGNFELEIVEVLEIPKSPRGKNVLVVHMDREGTTE